MFVANGPCRFGGRVYVIGEVIPNKYIDPRGAKRLVDAGILKEVSEEVGKTIMEAEDVVVYHEENNVVEESVQEESAVLADEAENGYESMSKKELLDLAKEKGLDAKPQMSKSTIIAMLTE